MGMWPNSPHLHKAVWQQLGLEEGEKTVQDVLPALAKDVAMAMGQGEDQVKDVTDLGTLAQAQEHRAGTLGSGDRDSRQALITNHNNNNA